MDEPYLSPAKRRKVEECFQEEMDGLIAKGATPADIAEEAFIELLVTNVEKHHSEVLNDPEISAYHNYLGILSMEPGKVREIASILRQRTRDLRALGWTARAPKGREAEFLAEIGRIPLKERNQALEDLIQHELDRAYDLEEIADAKEREG